MFDCCKLGVVSAERRGAAGELPLGLFLPLMDHFTAILDMILVLLTSSWEFCRWLQQEQVNGMLLEGGKAVGTLLSQVVTSCAG